MKVEVIDDTDESVKQQANGRCKNPLLKRGQVGIGVHVGTGTVDYRGSNIYMALSPHGSSGKQIHPTISGS